MKVGVLTAALQELTPRAVRDNDLNRAIEDWMQFARELAVDSIQLSARFIRAKRTVRPS